MRTIFDTTHKREIKVNIFMIALHNELILFQQSRNCFRYVPNNDIREDIFSWKPSPNMYDFPHNDQLTPDIVSEFCGC